MIAAVLLQPLWCSAKGKPTAGSGENIEPNCDIHKQKILLAHVELIYYNYYFWSFHVFMCFRKLSFNYIFEHTSTVKIKFMGDNCWSFSSFFHHVILSHLRTHSFLMDSKECIFLF